MNAVAHITDIPKYLDGVIQRDDDSDSHQNNGDGGYEKENIGFHELWHEPILYFFAHFAYPTAMQRRIVEPIVGHLLKRCAARIGAKVVIEPRWKTAGQITFRNGRRRYFRHSNLDLNPMGASEIAKDKDYANFFMRRMGYLTVRGEAFFSKEWAKTIGSKRTVDAALRFAERIGFPVMVKPNSGSQGNGVSLARTEKELHRALRAVFKMDNIALVQERIVGRDYRIVVLDGNIISAYERLPLSVVGDGRSTILSLLKKKQREFAASGRDTVLKLADPRIRAKLRREGHSMRSVPRRGERLILLDNANLSTGGEAREVVRLHPDFKKCALRLTRDMGLRLAGIDLMVDGALEEKPKRFWILEINAAPGLDHYARSGGAQKKIVEALYLKILKSLETFGKRLTTDAI